MSDFSSNAGGYGSGIQSSATLSAFFDSRSEADRAMERLRSAGVSDSCIRLTEGNEGGASGSTSTSTSSTGGQREDRGFFESLGDLFFPDEDRSTYAEGLSRGGYLVTVNGLSEDQYDIALDILDDEGAVNLDEREASWRSEGWSGYAGGRETTGYGEGVTTGVAASGATFADRDQMMTDDAGLTGRETVATGAEFTARDQTLREGETVPIVQEQLRVGKRDTSHGRVRVRSYVREVPVSEEVELRQEHVSIERRPVDRPVTSGDDAFRERSIEAEEHREEAVVSKEARVVEEVGLRREVETERQTISDVERHTEVEIEDERLDRTSGVSGSTGLGGDKDVNRR